MKSEAEAYSDGRAAFRAGKGRGDCPWPIPQNRDGSDENGSQMGAFWLDGFEQERDGVAPADANVE